LSHGTCSYIRMYINAVAVVCCGYDMVFITIFKVKHKLYTASGSALPPPPTRENSWVCTGVIVNQMLQ
jgi:hypothetical protein